MASIDLIVFCLHAYACQLIEWFCNPHATDMGNGNLAKMCKTSVFPDTAGLMKTKRLHGVSFYIP